MENPYMVQVPLDQDTVGTLVDLAQEFSGDGDPWTLDDVVGFLISEFLGTTNNVSHECGDCRECESGEKPPMTN